MKVKNVLGLAALFMAAIMISCNSDDFTDSVVTPDNSQPKMIRFTATIGPKTDGTRLLEDQETEITNTWNENDRIAMIINGTKYEGTVETVDNDGYAIVTGEIAEVPTGTPITFRYPYAAVDEAGEFRTDLLETQTGMLDDIDTRTGMSETVGELLIADGQTENKTATLKERVVLENKIAICRFIFKDKDKGQIENIDGVIINDANDNRLYYIHLPHENVDDRSKVYVAMNAIDPVAKLTFHVTTTEGERICTGTTNAKLQKGFYYKAELNLTEQQDLEDVEVDDVNWATENVGKGLGEYFAWGQTTGHVADDGYQFDWDHYEYIIFHSTTFPMPHYSISKYYPKGPVMGEQVGEVEWIGSGEPDGKTVLDLEDDAAHVNWGGNWRMPTVEEVEALLQKTNFNWVTGFDFKGMKVNGFKLVLKDDESKYIFLPTMGYRVYVTPGETGPYDSQYLGYYWSSSLYDKNPYMAKQFLCNPGAASASLMDRNYGSSIRPVRSK